MSQIERSLIYFEVVESTNNQNNSFRCKICKEIKKGIQKSNLTNHLRKRHQEIFENEILRKPENTAKMDQLILLQHMTETLAIDHLPFRFVLKPGFQNLILDRTQNLEKKGVPINLHDPNLTQLKNHLRSTAAKVKEKIVEEVGSKLLSMSCDIVSKNNRSILGVFIQYTLDGMMKVRCIGMLELQQRHTGQYLWELINGRLQEFGWTFSRFIALTTDNAGNMRTLLRNMNETDQQDVDGASSRYRSKYLRNFQCIYHPRQTFLPYQFQRYTKYSESDRNGQCYDSSKQPKWSRRQYPHR